MSMSRALVLGGRTGLLGMSLARSLEKAGYEVLKTPRPCPDHYTLKGLAELLDLAQAEVVFNTWAHTQVDQAEDEPEEAMRVNKTLPALLGRACKDAALPLVHYSTDFVFDGRSEAPYTEDDDTGPASVYGRSKLAGEKALLELDLPGLLIIRTSWLFGPGKKNFVRTMLELAAEKSELAVVHDQVGSPTYTPDLAAHSLALVQAGATGIFHVANAGRASWCELAGEAVRCAGLPCSVTPISSDQYPQKAPRPAFSVLDTSKLAKTTGMAPRPWVQAVQDYVYRRTMGGGDSAPRSS